MINGWFILFTVLGFTAGAIFVFILNYVFFSYKEKRVILEKEKTIFEEFKLKYKTFEEERKKYMEENGKEVNDAYHKGFNEGYLRAEMNSKILSLQIKPHIEQTEKKSFFKKNMTRKVGYQYQLLVNGIPCLQPHFIVESEINLSEANEENIKDLISKVKDSVDNAIKNIGGLANLSGDFGQLGDKLMKELPKRKK
jgi:hypothetical protein